MNKIILLAAFVGLASCGRLENVQYLPPSQRAQNDGGFQGNQAPHASNQGQYSGNQGQYSGNQGQYSGNQGQYSGNQGQYSGNQGQYSGNQGPYSGNEAAQYKVSANNDVPILKLDNSNEGDGHYNYALETGNGIAAHEQGEASNEAGTRAHGGFSYTSPEGEQIQINYSADENGYNPQGSHIPTSPPIPEDILKALEQNLADEARGIVDDGQYHPEAEEGQYKAGQYEQQGQNFGNQNKYIPPTQAKQGGYKY